MYKPNKTFLVCLFVYCVLVKVLPFALLHFGMDIRVESIYPWSFTPIFAFGIFGVAMFQNSRVAFGLPLLAMLIGDVLIGVITGLKLGYTEGAAYGLYPGQAFQYLGLLTCSACGLLIRYSRQWPTILTAVLAGPTLFFLISNFGAWAFDLGIGYARNLPGLMQAYVAGIPFYKNQLISTVCFSLILFSPVGIRTLLSQSPVRAVKPARASESASIQ
ncbi:DUF6580 family putative transport protein [Planctomicrobium sp. SH661]|uniref:DUF6580 family putative transport protein n=1 Tax=Planctomicrobium sp. SH661 TaxID=3448124 RepID=UPI003F5BA2B2